MDYLDLLADPAYRHMLLNHLPIAGLAVALLALVSGLVIRQRAVIICGLALVALTAGSSFPVAFFGDNAYTGIYDSLDGYGREWLDYHAEVAETWLPLLYGTAAFALAALVMAAVKRSLLLPAAILVVLLGAASLTAVSSIARSGGQIQHAEFRLTPTPG